MRAGFGWVTWVALLSAPPLVAQAPSADSARVLLQTADSLFNVFTPESLREAIRLRGIAAGMFRAAGDRRGEGEAYSKAGAAWYQLGEADSARRLAQQAFPLRLAGGDTAGAVRTLSGVLGPSFEVLGHPDSAIAVQRDAYRLAELTGNPLLIAQPAQNLGVVFIGLGQTDSALPWMHRTIALSRTAGDYRTEGDILNNLAVIFDDLGNSDSAFAYARRALAVGDSVKSDSLRSSALQNLGVLFEHRGAADSALATYRLAQVAAEQAQDARGQRMIVMNIGVQLHHLGQLDSAQTYYRESIHRSEEANDRAQLARALDNLGIFFTETHQFDSAAATFLTVRDIQRGLQNRRGEGIALVNLAKARSEQKRFAASLRDARTALAIGRELDFAALQSVALNIIASVFHLQGKPDSAVSYLRRDLAISRSMQDLRGEGVTLMMMGLAYQAGRRLARAVAYFDSAAAIKSRLARQVGGDFNRTTLGDREFDLYDAWSRAWLLRSGSIGARSAALGALGASERGRAQALLDLMNRADSSRGVRDLVGQASSAVAAVTTGGGSLLVYQFASDTLVIWAANSAGTITVRSLAVRKDSLSAMVRRLRAALGVEEGGLRLATRGPPLELGPPGAPTSENGNWQPAAAALARVLFPPTIRVALEHDRELLIVPQGSLALVPFGVLPFGANQDPLGSQRAVRYAPSIATAIAAEARPIEVGEAIVVGNPPMPRVQAANGLVFRLGALPGAEAEAQAVAGALKTTMLQQATASETAVKDRLEKASVVHLATHGYAYASEGQARSSFVALGPDTLNDGLLTVGELLDDSKLRLSANLVALSACQTGLGDLRQAEGTLGLQRAFLAKGARSVLVSLWNVSDGATRALMTSFYRNWLGSDRPSKSEALRRAQNEVREMPGFEHPRFWAAFQLVGAR